MHVDIWSDIACPWCAIGRAHFEDAKQRFTDDTGEPVTVRWRSFELNPGAPPERGGDYVQRLADKYGMPRAKAVEMIDQMQSRGRALGLPFDFDRVRAGNTFDAHRLLHLAHEHGVQDALKSRLFDGYFGEGVAVGDPEALVPLAVGVGLDEHEVRTVLSSDRFAAEVRAEEAQAHAIGVQGVPFFVVGTAPIEADPEGPRPKRYGVSGAQPADALLEVLHQARADGQVEAVAPAAQCDDAGCEVPAGATESGG